MYEATDGVEAYENLSYQSGYGYSLSVMMQYR